MQSGDFVAIHYLRDLIGHYFLGIAAVTISCVGLIGNLLSIGVLSSKYMRGTTTNLYLIALAASDSSMLFFALLVAIRDSRSPKYGVSMWQLWNDIPLVPQLYPLCHAFALLFQASSNWLTAAFTVDRYLMICHPFIAKRWCTLRLTKIVIASVFTASFCYTLPRFFEYEYLSESAMPPELTAQLGLPSVWFKLSAMGDSNSFRFGYHLWAWCILVIGFPSFIIAVLNVFLVREINRTIERMRHEHGVKSRRHETDVMLIGVIVIFFVCQIPSSVSHVVWGINGHGNDSVTWIVLNEVGNLFVLLNASINIIPYYLFSRRFRNLFVMIYFSWLKRCSFCCSCCGSQRSTSPTSHQLLSPPPVTPRRPRILTRQATQPLLFVPSSPLELPGQLRNKTTSCPFILVPVDVKAELEKIGFF